MTYHSLFITPGADGGPRYNSLCPEYCNINTIFMNIIQLFTTQLLLEHIQIQVEQPHIHSQLCKACSLQLIVK